MRLLSFLKKHKQYANVILFLAVAFLTACTIYKGINRANLIKSMKQISLFWLILCIAAVLTFILMEGIILWLLLKQKGKKLSVFRCVKYTLIGYFYSGLTPSASGGQPFQLYHMAKDGNGTAKSTAALLSMALFYKLIMVLMGTGLYLYWSKGIIEYFGIYVWVYYLGLSLNVIVLLAILSFMLIPEKAKGIIYIVIHLLINLKILKDNHNRNEKIDSFITNYKDSVGFLFNNKVKMGVLTLLTIIQRVSLLLIPVFIYMGLPLETEKPLTIFLIQAAIYVAVDMFPLPGAQGITEIIYINALGSIFTEKYLTASMIITRSVSFYLIFMIGMTVVLLNGCDCIRRTKRSSPRLVKDLES